MLAMCAGDDKSSLAPPQWVKQWTLLTYASGKTTSGAGVVLDFRGACWALWLINIGS